MIERLKLLRRLGLNQGYFILYLLQGCIDAITSVHAWIEDITNDQSKCTSILLVINSEERSLLSSIVMPKCEVRDVYLALSEVR